MDSFYHDDNLVFSVGNLFSAGTDTTGTTLRWGLLLMTKYPHIQGKNRYKHKHMYAHTHHRRLLRGGRLIIMAGMEWYQKYGNHVFDSVPAITMSPSSRIKVPPVTHRHETVKHSWCYKL